MTTGEATAGEVTADEVAAGEVTAGGVTAVEELIADWVARPENSARTVLVTIFGDTVLPVTASVWLAQLFRLTSELGYSERLARTSMFRLAADDWLTNERVGRQSRYTLTDAAQAESLEAGRRIYHRADPNWTGDWTLAFIDAPSVDAEARARVIEHLGWHGFVRLAPGVLASPDIDVARARDLSALAAAGTFVPMGRFRFDALDDVVAAGFLDATLDLTDRADAYDQFLETHRRVEAHVTGASAPQAFALRTMLIHDLRRIRLRGGDLPAALLPDDWPGREADALAARLYGELSAAAAPWLSELFERPYPVTLENRFNPHF